ncbi:Permuted papain-like amidase enzyme, YaeF/YiiX, C92 family [Lutibacter oricola]|uniref:Permuted papain-like amidase enzyme, YaeF/YiiX, C92 family n=1 Tax=Lutibacter oricola TaxID=762486 RepID=A0A1H3G2F6_9FLAO|nr:YiiX/YebB-like N1pC/P60 family cysteine hydrolase [Lutibacter oricola]SDX96888.1 Permuted papain-like amidase enzyme, YaeF/YiiX, C92 family [Lutibacter oricola]
MFLKIVKLTLILLTVMSCQTTQFELKEGDLLFQDLDKENIDNAIKKVTKTNLKFNFTHIGIVVSDNNELKVLEAVSKGVQLSSISDFLNRNLINGKPKVVVGQLKKEFRTLIKPAIEHGKTLIGLPYDKVYIIGDNNYYCSELLYEMFHKADPNTKTFQLNPMTFKDPKTNKTLEFWTNYYAKLNHKIPEGELGLNPNGMSVSPNITLIYDYFAEKELN